MLQIEAEKEFKYMELFPVNDDGEGVRPPSLYLKDKEIAVYYQIYSTFPLCEVPWISQSRVPPKVRPSTDFWCLAGRFGYSTSALDIVLSWTYLKAVINP